jgi:hypothetical protein
MHHRRPSRFGRFVKRAIFAGFVLIFCAGAGGTLFLRWQYGQLGADLGKERARAKKNGLRLNAEEFVRAVAPEKNAAADIRAAIAAIETLPKEESKAAFLLAKEILDRNAPLVPNESWGAMMAVQKKVIPHVEKAAAKPDCDFGRDWSEPISMTFPEYARIRQMNQLLTMRALMSAHEGQFREAFEDLRSALRLSEHIGREPVLIAALVRNSGRTMAVRTAERILGTMPAGRIQAQGCMDRILPDLKIERDFLDAFRGETFFAVHIGRNVGRFAKDYGKVMAGPEPPEEGFDWQRFLFLPPFQDPERVGRAYETQVLKFWNDLFEEAEQQKWPPDKLSQQMDIRSRLTAEGHLLTRAFLGVVFPVFAGFGENVMADRARTQLAIAARDVFEYRMQKGKYPASLDLATKAVDPYTGQPLHYRVTEDGFLVYSVGKDREDNGGVRRPKSIRPDQAQMPFDEVFQVGGAEIRPAAEAPKA